MSCLLCLKEKESRIQLCSRQGLELNCSLIIAKHFWLKPRRGYSKECICLDCWTIVKSFHQFYESVAEAHNYLQNETFLNTAEFPESMKEPKLEISDLERLPFIEVLEHLEDSCNGQVFEKDESGEIKTESKQTSQAFANCSDDSSEMELPLSTLLLNIESRSDAHNIPKNSNTINSIENKESTNPDSEVSNNGFESINCNDVENCSLTETQSDSRQSFDSSEESSADETIFSDTIKKTDEKDEKNSAALQLRKKKKYKTKPKTPKPNKFDENIAKLFEKLKCSTCNFLVDNFKELKQHMQKTHNSSPFVECCQRKFSTRRQLYNHVLTHLKETEFKCNMCKKSFENDAALQEHMKKHECEECSRIFADLKNLRQHKLIVHLKKSEYNFACTECDAKFPVKRKLTYHFRSVHGLENPCICDKCGKTFRNLYAVNKHMSSHSEYAYLKGEPAQCDVCGKWLKHKQSLTGHKLYVHSQPVKCGICEKKLKTVRELREHMNVHTKEEVFTCQVCSKTFSRRATLREHVKNIHSSNPTLLRKQCGTCGLWFFTSKTLRTHIRNLHSKKSKQCTCPICGMTSVHQWALKRHMKLRHGCLPPDSKSEEDQQVQS